MLLPLAAFCLSAPFVVEDGYLGAVPQGELGKYRADVIAHRSLREKEARGDLGVVEALRDESDHLSLALGKRRQGGLVACRNVPAQRRRPLQDLSLQDALAGHH